MNKRLQSKLSMYLVVRKQMISETVVMGSLPGFEASSIEFETNLQQIVDYNERQNFKGVGVTAEKDELKSQLLVDAMSVSSKVLSYGRFHNLTALIPDVAYTMSDLKRLSSQNVLGVAGSILIRGTENLSKMTGFLLTLEELDRLRTSIDNYRTASSSPRILRTEKKITNRELETCFDLADSALGKVDIVMELIRYSKPDVYLRYKMARKLELMSSSYISLKGSVKDATTSMPITAAQITFVELNNTGVAMESEEPVLTKSTAEKGGFLVKTLAEGNYRVTVSKIGYKEKTMNVAVTASEMQDLVLVLESA